MQCPPSPLLFDPSVALRDVAEAPIDILALEEPAQPGLPLQPTPVDRGAASAYVFSPSAAALAELPAQVQPGEPRGGASSRSTGRTAVPEGGSSREGGVPDALPPRSQAPGVALPGGGARPVVRAV